MTKEEEEVYQDLYARHEQEMQKIFEKGGVFDFKKL